MPEIPTITIAATAGGGTLPDDKFFLVRDGVQITPDNGGSTLPRITDQDAALVFSTPQAPKTYAYQMFAGQPPARLGTRSTVLSVTPTLPVTTVANAVLWIDAAAADDAPLVVEGRVGAGAYTPLGQFSSTDARYPTFARKQLYVLPLLTGQLALDAFRVRFTRSGGSTTGYSDIAAAFLAITMTDGTVFRLRPNEDVGTATMALYGGGTTAYGSLAELITETDPVSSSGQRVSASAYGQFAEVGFETTTITVSDDLPPGPPAQPTVVSGSTTQVVIGWQPNPESDVIGYRVFRSVDAGAGSVVAGATTPLDATTYTDATVTTGHTYRYWLVAVDASEGESIPGQQLVVPIAAAPAVPTITATSLAPTYTDGPFRVRIGGLTAGTSHAIYRDGELIASGITTATWDDTTASVGSHSYTAKAGSPPNESAASTAVVGIMYGIQPSAPEVWLEDAPGGSADTELVEVTGLGDWEMESSHPAVTLDPSSGTLADPNTPASITVSADAGSLPPQTITGTLTLTVTIPGQPPPTTTVSPWISTDGTPTVGETITGHLGTWTGSPTSYAWKFQRDTGSGFADIGGASGTTGNPATTPTYELVTADGDNDVRLVVTATAGEQTGTANSLPVTVAAAAGPTLATSVRYFDGDDRINLTAPASLTEPLTIGAVALLATSATSNRNYVIVSLSTDADTMGRGLAVEGASTGRAMWVDNGWGFDGPPAFPKGKMCLIVGRANNDASNSWSLSFLPLDGSAGWAHRNATRATRGPAVGYAWTFGAADPNDTAGTWTGAIAAAFCVQGSYLSNAQVEALVSTDPILGLYVARSTLEAIPGVDYVWRLDQASVATAVPDTVGTAEQTQVVGTSVTDAATLGIARIPWAGDD